MKLFILLTLFLYTSYTGSAQGNWVRKADFGNSPRREAVGLSIGNKGYVGGGNDGTFPHDFWEYDPGLDTWTQKANCPASLCCYPVTYSINGKGYYYNFEYDPALNVWTTKAFLSFPHGEGGYYFTIGNYGYYGSGYSHTGIPPHYAHFNQLFRYDPTSDTWTQMASGPYRCSSASFSIGNEGYIISGMVPYDTGTYYSNAVEVYNSITNTWSNKGAFPGGVRVGANGFTIDFQFGSRGFVGLGYDESLGYHSDFWEYNPDNDSWIQRPDYPGGVRAFAVGFSIATKGYLGTGAYISNSMSQDFWEYTPDSTIGIDEVENDIQVLINPNPASDIFTVSISPSHSLKTIEIYNSSGERMSVFEDITESLTDNSNKYSKGIYFIKVQTEKGSIVKKLIVQ